MNIDRDERVRFWHLVNTYVTMCDGDPGRNVYGNTARQEIVAKIEAMVLPGTRDSGPELEAAREALRQIAEFGEVHTGCGFTCSKMAKKALNQ